MRDGIQLDIKIAYIAFLLPSNIFEILRFSMHEYSQSYNHLSKNNDDIINKNDTILVTGSNGFVGSRLVDILLSHGYQNIRCLLRTKAKSNSLDRLVNKYGHDKLEIIEGNLLSESTCRDIARDVSVVYHLAAGIDKTYPGCFLNSVVATHNLLRFLVNGNKLKRFVNISSISSVFKRKALSWWDIR